MENKRNQGLLYLDKIDFKPKPTRDEKGHYVMIKGSIHQKDVTTVKIYGPTLENLTM